MKEYVMDRDERRAIDAFYLLREKLLRVVDGDVCHIEGYIDVAIGRAISQMRRDKKRVLKGMLKYMEQVKKEEGGEYNGQVR